MTTRRMLLALAAALPILSAGVARAQDNVSLRLNWYLGGLHVPFYYGVEKGFFKEEGLDVEIVNVKWWMFYKKSYRKC